jgi:hypothetical protein
MRAIYSLGTLLLVIAGLCGCGGAEATPEEVAAVPSPGTQPVNCATTPAACR